MLQKTKQGIAMLLFQQNCILFSHDGSSVTIWKVRAMKPNFLSLDMTSKCTLYFETYQM